MAIKSIGHRPELTIESAREIFERGMAGRYDIVSTEARRRHFIVRKDGWSGVGVKLQQRGDETRFVYTGMISHFWLNFFFGGMFSYFMLRKTWKAMESEVARYIEDEPAFASMPPGEQLKAA
jgi:hypothetical protein